MTVTEVIQKDGQRYLYVKSGITSGTTQYDVLQRNGPNAKKYNIYIIYI